MVEVAEEMAKDRTMNGQIPSSSDIAKDKAEREKAPRVDDLGPTLAKLKWRRKIWLVFIYAFKRQKLPITIIGAFIIFIVLGALFWSELRLPAAPSHTPGSIIEWLLNAQTILSIGTLLVALFVWIGEIEENWENSLQKRLSVFFFWKGMPLIVCRYVWLAGEDEIRTWGQQVAVQAQDVLEGEKPADSFLHFVPDMKTKNHEFLVGLDGDVCKHYSICFSLTRLNKSLERTKKSCRYQNIAGIDKVADNFPIKLVESIPEVASWKRVMIRKI